MKMNILYYDCFAGISGDMNLAAMIDLGVPPEVLTRELSKLQLNGYSIDVQKAIKKGISGTSVHVKIEHDHSNEGHKHDHSHGHGHHRTFKNIKKLILESALSDKVKDLSIEIFNKIAVAEGKIHDKPAEDVHFHEVGAIDSIVDIVGAAICFDYLSPDKVFCSTVELGGGFVNCAHGKFPVPAPATAEILKGIPVKTGTVNKETTTPTGAAILATLVDEFTDQLQLSINTTAYGIGHHDFEIPNVLRVHKAVTSSINEVSGNKMLECNIDDMSAEQIGFLVEYLMDSGASDVYLTPISMKKSRPAHKLSVLCNTESEEEIANIIFTESSTLGYRSFPVDKVVMERKTKNIETRFGKIDVKIAYLNGAEVKIKPEFEQCKIAALKNNVPLRVVSEEVIRAYKSNYNE